MHSCEASAASKLEESSAYWAQQTETAQEAIRVALMQAHAEREAHTAYEFHEATAAAVAESNA